MINLVSHYTWIWTHCILLWYLGRLQHRLYVGVFPAPHARTGGVLIFALRRVKHTNTIFYVVRQIRLHPRERFILLKIEKGYNKYMEEEDCIHSTQLPAHFCCSCCNGSKAAAIAALLPFSLFSSHTHVISHSLNTLKTCLFYRQFLAIFSSNNKGTIGPEIMPLIVALVMLPLSHN